MRLAHVRDREDPVAPWRLVAALDDGGTYWADLEIVQQRVLEARPTLRDRVLSRLPITTLDDHLARGLRVGCARARCSTGSSRGPDDDDPAVLRRRGLRFGPPILRPPCLRDFYAFEQHVRTTWARGGRPLPEAWHRLPIFYFCNVSELRGPMTPCGRRRDRRSSTTSRGGRAGRYTGDRPRPRRAEEAIGGYIILNDWSARDLQRDETIVRMGSAKGKDFATLDRPVAGDAG